MNFRKAGIFLLLFSLTCLLAGKCMAGAMEAGRENTPAAKISVASGDHRHHQPDFSFFEKRFLSAEEDLQEDKHDKTEKHSPVYPLFTGRLLARAAYGQARQLAAQTGRDLVIFFNSLRL